MAFCRPLSASVASPGRSLPGRRPPAAGRLLRAVVPLCGLCCCPLSVVLSVSLCCSCRPPGHAVPVRCCGPSCGPLWASWRRRSSYAASVAGRIVGACWGCSWASCAAAVAVWCIYSRDSRPAFRCVHVPCVTSDLLDFQRPAGDTATPAPPGVSPSTTKNVKKINPIRNSYTSHLTYNKSE